MHELAIPVSGRFDTLMFTPTEVLWLVSFSLLTVGYGTPLPLTARTRIPRWTPSPQTSTEPDTGPSPLPRSAMFTVPGNFPVDVGAKVTGSEKPVFGP